MEKGLNAGRYWNRMAQLMKEDFGFYEMKYGIRNGENLASIEGRIGVDTKVKMVISEMATEYPEEWEDDTIAGTIERLAATHIRKSERNSSTEEDVANGKLLLPVATEAGGCWEEKWRREKEDYGEQRAIFEVITKKIKSSEAYTMPHKGIEVKSNAIGAVMRHQGKKNPNEELGDDGSNHGKPVRLLLL